MEKTRFTLYLDESGNELLFSPEEYLENPKYETHCTLVGVIIDHSKKKLLKEELLKVKKEFWRSDKVILHNVEIRHKSGPFAIFYYNPNLYEKFKEKMNLITQKVDPIILCSSLDKKLWVEKYPKKLFYKDNPYESAFVYLLERYAHFLNNQNSGSAIGFIEVESRGDKKNMSLKEAYSLVKNNGTQYNSKKFFSKMNDRIAFYPKKFNIPGMQLSDYFCYCFYSNHKDPEKENNHYHFLEKFIYPGEYGQYGHKKWPI
jgi:uncharacterized protein YrzB (UPF0473 family)